MQIWSSGCRLGSESLYFSQLLSEAHDSGLHNTLSSGVWTRGAWRPKLWFLRELSSFSAVKTPMTARTPCVLPYSLYYKFSALNLIELPSASIALRKQHKASATQHKTYLLSRFLSVRLGWADFFFFPVLARSHICDQRVGQRQVNCLWWLAAPAPANHSLRPAEANLACFMEEAGVFSVR